MKITISTLERGMLTFLGRKIAKKHLRDRIDELPEIYSEDVEARLENIRATIKALKKERETLYLLINPKRYETNAD